MKIIVTILILLLVIVYVGFFLKSTEIFRDSGSCKIKEITSILGFKSTEIEETTISRYITKHGIKNSESWVNIASIRGGLFRERFLPSQEFNYDIESNIGLLSKWLDENQDLKNTPDTSKETLIKLVVVNFLDCLKNGDSDGIDQLIKSLNKDKMSDEKKDRDESR